jgi:hypothetical protein
MEKLCLECRKPLGAGRADRRFCNDACKTKFHNTQKIFEHGEIKKIENVLKRLKQFRKEVYYYQQQIKEYKKSFENPSQVEEHRKPG